MIATEVQTEPVVEVIAASTKPIESDSEAEAKAFIYFKESSGQITATNSLGCKGIGQDCNGNLEIYCPDWQSDYECQDKWFDSYAKTRYNGWKGAYQFWIKNNWW